MKDQPDGLSEVYKVRKFGSNDPLEWKGPLFKEAIFQSGKAYVTFENGTDRGLRLDQDVDVGFVLAGEDKNSITPKQKLLNQKSTRNLKLKFGAMK